MTSGLAAGGTLRSGLGAGGTLRAGGSASKSFLNRSLRSSPTADPTVAPTSSNAGNARFFIMPLRLRKAYVTAEPSATPFLSDSLHCNDAMPQCILPNSWPTYVVRCHRNSRNSTPTPAPVARGNEVAC